MVFLAVVFLAVVFLAVDFLAVDFLAAGFLAVVFLAAVLLAGFFAAVLRVVFLAAVFLAAGLALALVFVLDLAGFLAATMFLSFDIRDFCVQSASVLSELFVNGKLELAKIPSGRWANQRNQVVRYTTYHHLRWHSNCTPKDMFYTHFVHILDRKLKSATGAPLQTRSSSGAAPILMAGIIYVKD